MKTKPVDVLIACQMESKFPGHGIVVIRSFVFLRLICPALINPEAFLLLVSGYYYHYFCFCHHQYNFFLF